MFTDDKDKDGNNVRKTSLMQLCVPGSVRGPPGGTPRRPDSAVIYGDKKAPLSIEIEERVVRRVINEAGIFGRLLDINVEGTPQPC